MTFEWRLEANNWGLIFWPQGQPRYDYVTLLEGLERIAFTFPLVSSLGLHLVYRKHATLKKTRVFKFDAFLPGGLISKSSDIAQSCRAV